jgi:hypothetical protein
VNTVPFADESESEFFADQGAAVSGDGDRVLEISDAPIAGLGGCGGGECYE